MSRHLKRLSAPEFWKVAKKLKKWVTRPRPGPHKLKECIPLLILIRDILKLADNAKEARKIIKAKEIFVDGKPRKDHKFPVGLFDSVSIPKIGKNYRIVPTLKGLDIVEIAENEAKLKICKIINKKVLKKQRLQINLNDGKNILANLECKTGDSLLLELPSLKIVDHIKLEKGNFAIIAKGKNSGLIGKIEEINEGKIVLRANEKSIKALKDHVFVVGRENPLITVKK